MGLFSEITKTIGVYKDDIATKLKLEQKDILTVIHHTFEKAKTDSNFGAWVSDFIATKIYKNKFDDVVQSDFDKLRNDIYFALTGFSEYPEVVVVSKNKLSTRDTLLLIIIITVTIWQVLT